MTTVVHALRDDALGNTSYLMILDDRTAISIDPPRDADEHLALARRLETRIVGVLETHLHADFVSGAREVADASGATIHAAADARLAGAHVPVTPAERIALGHATVEVIETPGHTPEHVSFLVTAGDTRALFSGGSLIVGGAARTDLTGFERTDTLARAQFASLRRLAELPDDTAVDPTHGAGSFCSTGPARSSSTTIGAERSSNALFGITDEDEFVRRLRAGFGSYPRYFVHLREVNRAGAPPLRTLGPVPELPPETAKHAADRGAWLIDGRPADAWASAHPTGAVSIVVRPAFASWLGWVVPFGAPAVLVLHREQLPEAVRLARRIGYDRIEGWTTYDAWSRAGLPVSSTEMVTAPEAEARAERGATIIDVRQRTELAGGRIPGATHIELGDVIAGVVPEAAEVIAYCSHGERSATAASLLERRGIRVANLDGGISGWRRAGLPIAS